MSDSKCVFCDLTKPVILAENKLCLARLDSHPVSDGHILIITKRHFSNYFDATFEERTALWNLVEEVKHLIRKDKSPDGYNIGINIGKAAGQTIPHLHVHLIPRYEGDIDDPTGGVRGVIPGKQKYF